MTPQPILALGCTRQQGKDTLARLMHQLDPRIVAFSFATALKRDLHPFLLDHYGVDIWTCPIEEKELIRPLLIAHGMCQRARDPDYWVKRTVQDIEDHLARTSDSHEVIPVITDCRFLNEVTVLRARFPGFRFVNVTREGAPPPTEEETRHCAAVSALADYYVHWGNDTPEEQLEIARRTLSRTLG